MKVVYPLGMMALAGAVFLALGALSASARMGGMTPAETHANAPTPATVMSGPSTPVVLTPPVVAPTPVPPEPWPLPVPVPSADASPIRTFWEAGTVGELQPVIGDRSISPVPPPTFPNPPVTLEG